MKKYIEIRPGSGGKEAELLSEEIMCAYLRYCSKNNISVIITDDNCRTLSFIINGKNLDNFDNEIGVHKFQRVSKTDKCGRVHTSTVSVAVLTIEEHNIKKYYDDKDLRIDRFHCGGHGGQHVNKVETGIRIVHIPTNTMVVSTSERSQYKNKMNGYEVLNAKLKELHDKSVSTNIKDARKTQIKNNDRTESRRTYNEQRNEIYDNIIGLSMKYKDFFKGNLIK